MRFNSRDLEQIARGFGASPRAVERLISLVEVKIGERRFTIGLAIDSTALAEKQRREVLIEQLITSLLEYRRLCSKVLQWLQRGDFDPTKVPENLSKGELLHASRTGFRLRAKLLRQKDFLENGKIL